INVPDDLLRRNSDLNQDERSVVKAARERALEVLNGIPGFEETTDLIKHQFEYFDGTLSPEGLRGEQIPLGSRIIAVVKEYERMISPVLGMTEAEAVNELSRMAGGRFDPGIVDAFCNLSTSEGSHEAMPELTLA
ncbi:MAG TPA: HD domain-containing phosphohydrolase, partial [Pyrinomonadaceae bacterium]|nr:HD domain-containing phosphohydrolase [Pyrinomonadaceae bacterium]